MTYRLKACVIGAGSWGTAMAVHLASLDKSVTVWNKFEDEIEKIKNSGENEKYLPGIKIPENVSFTTDMQEATRDAELIVFALPSPLVRVVAKELSRYVLKGQIIVNLSKGLEKISLKRLSVVLSEEIPQGRIVVMSGPSHAEEVSQKLPTTNVVASTDSEAACFVQEFVMNENFRLYTSEDVVGVELGGALKNVIALCAGMSDGLGYGDNTKAALMTRGLEEIKRLGVAMGAESDTFLGLSGMGDLIVTCTSMHSRNRRAGILLGKGKALEEVLKEVGMVVEGVNTAEAAYELSKKYDVSMPIVKEANRILFEGKNPREAVNDLMTREKKAEHR